ncbi:MAG TPA: hypothetical protein VF994_10795 [Myxococcales bacterium]
MTALVAPARMRSTMAEENGVVRVRIPARRNWFLGLFLVVWLCGWLAGEILTLRSAFGARGGARAPPTPFLLLWIAGWTVGGAFAVYAWIWNAFGREVIELDGRALIFRREPIGLPPRKEYDLLHVRNLRVVPFDGSIWSGRESFAGMRGGPLAFDYGAKTVRFGAGVDEAEARMILDSIRTRFPELGS